ncbi:ComGF family competence protein [Gracilibacillus caseinilyticus]|uniref:ComGF family competence protein n=1 Tax=Gracilibacillus caseinilyticus TaxID=2932256 RepID=A0ABY4EUY6_9BACI|nr:ComGF family competence protein [Gracilibacillus caseinilyticus]UOQ47459.1 ComGF family competence protein [Gracilibacillus caseinilyticus]
MLNNKKQPHAYMVSKNEKGYLIFEVMFSTICLSMMLIWLGQILILWHQNENDSLPQVYHFHHLIELEAETAESISVQHNQLYFIQTTGERVTISYHNYKIRRQVDSKGQEEIVRDISDFEIIDRKFDIVIRIKTQSGEAFEKYLFKKGL